MLDMEKLETYDNSYKEKFSSQWKEENYTTTYLGNCDQLHSNSTTWCIPANLAKFNVVEAFNNLKKINWWQSTNIKVGDIVYIYIAKPVQAIQYKCYANAVDLESQEIDDMEYYVDREFHRDHGRFMELELLDSFDTSAYELEYLEKQDFSIPQGPIRLKPKTKSYLNLVEKLKNTEEMDPDKHDGSYELVRETIRSYASLTDLSMVDYRDLNLVYLMTIGTWRHGIDSKRRSIEESHLPEGEQERLNLLLTEVWDKNNEYENRENKEASIGMFGTGFFSFKGKTDEDSPRNFIKICIDILDLEEDQEIFDKCQTTLTKDFSGMGAASAYVVLHCLKPFTFPIFNSNMGADNIFSYLGISL